MSCGGPALREDAGRMREYLCERTLSSPFPVEDTLVEAQRPAHLPNGITFVDDTIKSGEPGSPGPLARQPVSVEASCSADHASRCKAVVFSRLGTRFRGYANVITGISLPPHVTRKAGVGAVRALRVSASIGLTVVIRRLCACLRGYTYMITGKRLTPNISLTTSVCHRTLLPSSTDP